MPSPDTSRSRTIAILLPNLKGGGAERMRVNLARVWLAEGFNVDFVLQKKEGELLELLPAGCRVFDLNAPRIRSTVGPLRSYLREQRPTVLLAAMWPLTSAAILAARLSGTATRVVVSDHNILTITNENDGPGPIHAFFMGAIILMTYPMANVRVAVSEGVADTLSALSKIPKHKFKVIYNPAAALKPTDFVGPCPPELANLPHPLILTVGSLKQEKNHAMLIKAFRHIADQTTAILCILGEGQERDQLERLVQELNLSGRVLMPGFRLDPTPWYRRASLFVLSSIAEGFGNVLVEALEQGVPVVSTDCPSGPREILADGAFGHLVPPGDPEALGDAILAALSTPHDPERLKARAQDFTLDKIARQYLEVLVLDWNKEQGR